MIIVVEAFDKKTELLSHEIKIKEEYLPDLFNILGLTKNEQDFLISGAGGFDIDNCKIKEIEILIGEKIYSPLCDFQLGTS